MSSIDSPTLEKCPTGITGFDEISASGLPKGRSTLIAGHAGSGKTLFAMEFILNGIQQYNEPGVFISFEESPQDLSKNVASLGFDLAQYEKNKLLQVLYIPIEAQEMVEAGEFDLDGLFIRIGMTIDRLDAKRIALDGVENLFSGFSDMRILRAEFRRLIDWLKSKNITAIVTTERGTDSITRHGLEEYIADCVITLDNRIENQLATRRLRIIKFRGSTHGIDEYPFTLGRYGFSVLPITSAGLNYSVSTERIASGINSLDSMLGEGLYCGSSILISGTSGSGKSSIAATFIDTACARGEHCLYLAYEESPEQIKRNMLSIGINLQQWQDAGLLHFHAVRPTAYGLENHLVNLIGLLKEHKPNMVILDPITSFHSLSDDDYIKIMLVRFLDQFKALGITAIFTSLTFGDTEEASTIAMSSLMDVWLLVRNLETSGERARGLYVSKARGIAHSNQIREFLLTNQGIQLEDVALNKEGHILTGSARMAFAMEKENELNKQNAEMLRRRNLLKNKREALDAQISALREDYEQERHFLEFELKQENTTLESENKKLDELIDQRNLPSGELPS